MTGGVYMTGGTGEACALRYAALEANLTCACMHVGTARGVSSRRAIWRHGCPCNMLVKKEHVGHTQGTHQHPDQTVPPAGGASR
jgi:hypothetical protein